MGHTKKTPETSAPASKKSKVTKRRVSITISDVAKVLRLLAKKSNVTTKRVSVI